MPQHLLNGAQIGSTLEQVGGKGVAERVGADRLFDAGKLAQPLDNVEHHDACELCSTAVEKQVIFAAALYGHVAAHFVKVESYLLKGFLRNGHKALLVAFALDYNIFVVGINLRQLEVGQL